MKPLRNTIFVKIEKKFDDEIKTNSGVTFYKDTTYKPEENSCTSGIVVATPEICVNEFPDFAFPVDVGDKLYFHYNVVLDNDNLVVHEGEEYWMIDYWMAIATVRGGKIIPCGKYILLEKPEEKKVESSLIIIPDNAEKVRDNRYKVFASNLDEVKPGSEVAIDPVGEFENIIEGQSLYCAMNENILFTYDQVG